jgi:hypothetical protein
MEDDIDLLNIQYLMIPQRFPGVSPKMVAIMGYLIGVNFTCPHFVEMVATSDGFLLARLDNDCGCNEFIGGVEDFKRNWDNLIHIPDIGLSEKEIKYLEMCPRMKIRDYHE